MTTKPMIRVGEWYLNLSAIQAVHDLFPSTREDELVVYLVNEEVKPLTFRGQDADNLRTWLNSTTNDLTHLHVDSTE